MSARKSHLYTCHGSEVLEIILAGVWRMQRRAMVVELRLLGGPLVSGLVAVYRGDEPWYLGFILGEASSRWKNS